MSEALRFLYDLQLFGIKAGLENILALLDVLGHPEKNYPCIHIAGTNGKGSTASMIAAILSASGYRTGLYTSPHLLAFNERIRVGGKMISDEDLTVYTRRLKSSVTGLKATFFEATTAIAFQYFADKHVDIAVIETGLGGRWDATNVVTPLVSVITNIGLDHTEYLGSSYSKIAFEKGGIIKKGVPCITAAAQPEALRRLNQIAHRKQSPLMHIDNVSSVSVKASSVEGLAVSFSGSRLRISDVKISLAGDHQVRNVQLALSAVEFLKYGPELSRISVSGIRKGLGRIRHYSGLRGRFEIIQRRAPVIADVGHNPAGVETLVRTLKKLIPGKCVLVFGVMKDKEYRTMVKTLAPAARIVVAVRPDTERALDGSAIAQLFHAARHRALDGGSVANGLAIALEEARAGEPILITGSHYVVGEAMQAVQVD